MPKQGEVDGCGTGVILAIAAAALVMLLSFGGGSVLAEERGPECHTTQTVLVACGDDKATIDWTAGNYWGKPLLLQVVMGGQATMVPLDNGQTTSGTFETGLATLPAGEVWFVWADSRGSWTEKVAYEARSCVTDRPHAVIVQRNEFRQPRGMCGGQQGARPAVYRDRLHAGLRVGHL